MATHLTDSITQFCCFHPRCLIPFSFRYSFLFFLTALVWIAWGDFRKSYKLSSAMHSFYPGSFWPSSTAMTIARLQTKFISASVQFILIDFNKFCTRFHHSQLRSKKFRQPSDNSEHGWESFLMSTKGMSWSSDHAIF